MIAATPYSDPIRVVVSGLTPSSMIDVDVRSGDGASHALMRADEDGVVDLARDAPQEGTWSGADADGFLWSLDGGSALRVIRSSPWRPRQASPS